MKKVGIILGAVLVVVTVWHIALAGAIEYAGTGDAWLDQGRVWPYTHAHLGEEFTEGTFSPTRDLLFLTSAGLRNVLPFALGLAIVEWRLESHVFESLIVFGGSVFILHLVHFGAHFPRMVGPYGFELGFAAVEAGIDSTDSRVGLKPASLSSSVPGTAVYFVCPWSIPRRRRDAGRHQPSPSSTRPGRRLGRE